MRPTDEAIDAGKEAYETWGNWSEVADAVLSVQFEDEDYRDEETVMGLREELIQVAAVAIAIVEDLDGNRLNAQGDVSLERRRQNELWGEQHHPIAEWLSILGEEYGEACKAANDEIIFPKERQ